jgi:hypothetical protein
MKNILVGLIVFLFSKSACAAFALVLNGQVVQISPATFPTSPEMTWVDVDGISPAPEYGWAYDGSNFTAPAVPAPPSIVSYELFQNRFTADELDALGEFVYETDTDTGKLKRVRLMQAYNRAVASNLIDLIAEKTATFMASLVEGEVLTQARSDQILDPSQSSP